MIDVMVPQRFSDLRREMDRLFEDFFGSEGRGVASPASFPALNVWEDSQNVYVEAEMPGVKIDDVEISVSGDQLTLRGKREAEANQGSSCHRREREFGAFARSVRLMSMIDASKVEATLKNGVLTVALPKSEAAKPRRIEVKSAR